jgi:hypothetical protein
MNKKEEAGKRDPTSVGRRLADHQTPTTLMAAALVNLSGAPAKVAVKWGMVVWLASVIGGNLVEIVRALKGTTTLADIQINMGAALSVGTETGQASKWPMLCELLMYSAVGATLVAFVAVIYAFRERALRNQVIREMGQEITILEKIHDKDRSSSGLTPTGGTHPKDL